MWENQKYVAILFMVSFDQTKVNNNKTIFMGEIFFENFVNFFLFARYCLWHQTLMNLSVFSAKLFIWFTSMELGFSLIPLFKCTS